MKTCIITGGNSGIGKSAAHQIAGKGYQVVLACRNLDAAEKVCAEVRESSGNQNVHAMRVDLSSMEGVRRFANAFREQYKNLDVLINNAADFDISRKAPLITSEGNEAQWATNFMAPVVLTNELLPLLKCSEDGRIINIASQGLMVYPNIKLDFDNFKAEKTYNATKAYYQSKLALLTYSNRLRQALAGTSVSVHAIRVSNVKVDISRYPNISKPLRLMYRFKSKFSISPDEMAVVYTELATGRKMDGFYYDEKMREVSANKAAYDINAAKRLWDMTLAY